MSGLVLVAALAFAGDAPLPDTVGTGPQAITIAVSGVDAGTTLVVERPGVGTIALRDPGTGFVQGTFNGEPARFAQLRVYAQDTKGRRDLFDGLVVLSDARRDTVAFALDRDGAFARLPIAPSLHAAALARDPTGPWRVSMGWAALAFGYVGLLGVTWALRRR